MPNNALTSYFLMIPMDKTKTERRDCSMSLDFFNNLKQNLEKNDTLSKIGDVVTDFIGELSEALQKSNISKENQDIVSQIASENKLTMASENGISQARSQIVEEYAKKTQEEGNLYFIFNQVKGEDKYRVWEYNGGERTQIEIDKKDLPAGAMANSVMRMQDGKLKVDQEGTNQVLQQIKEKAEEIIEKQNQKIEAYKKEGHIYQVTEDINGRVFLWDTTEKPNTEIEDVYFPEELKEKAREGNRFLYQNGTYTHII